MTRYQAALEYIRAVDRLNTAQRCGWTSYQHHEQVRAAERAYTELSTASPGRAEPS